MTPNEWLLDETRKWVQRAEKDLRVAELCAAELPAEALFHCQHHKRAGKALEQLNAGLQRFVERELKASYKDRWVDAARPTYRSDILK